VGYQRLLTTNPSDVETPREYRKERVEEAITEIVQTNKEVLSKLNSERNYDKDISFLRLNSMPDSKRLQNDKIKTKFWLTK
jgi:small-conductance mechanosensitive channel